MNGHHFPLVINLEANISNVGGCHPSNQLQAIPVSILSHSTPIFTESRTTLRFKYPYSCYITPLVSWQVMAGA